MKEQHEGTPEQHSKRADRRPGNGGRAFLDSAAPIVHCDRYRRLTRTPRGVGVAANRQMRRPLTSTVALDDKRQRDSTWRRKINAMLGKRMSLDEIAGKLNAQKVPTIHGTNRWTASSVRKAFVS